MHKIVILMTLLLVSCQDTIKENNKLNVVATIPPVQFIIDRIADTTINTFSLLGESTSPETFDITPAGMKYVANSDLIFSIGFIDFEQTIEQKIESLAPKSIYIRLSDVTDPIVGSCSHGDHSHSHGIDPHVWLSLANMESMVEMTAAVLIDKLPQYKSLYIANRDKLLNEIFEINSKADSMSNKVKSFAIVHPSLTYFARDYDLEQIAIEQEGKEPSAAALKKLIDEMKAKNCKTIFYAQQNPVIVANHIAAEIGAKTIKYDPVQYQWLDGMTSIVEILSNSENN